MKKTELGVRGLVRLIPYTNHKPPVLRSLVDSDAEAQVLAEIESYTNERLIAEDGRSPNLDPRELSWKRRANDLRVYGDSHVNAAFTYTRAGGNRFNGETRGAWYCSWDAAVSIAEVAFHRTRELQYTNWLYDQARYVELHADFIGTYDDITDDPDHPALNPNPMLGYPEGQALAELLRREGSHGLVYPSVRAPKGNCLVCFEPRDVQNVRPGATYDIVWNGSPEYDVAYI